MSYFYNALMMALVISEAINFFSSFVFLESHRKMRFFFMVYRPVIRTVPVIQ